MFVAERFESGVGVGLDTARRTFGVGAPKRRLVQATPAPACVRIFVATAERNVSCDVASVSGAIWRRR